MAILEEFKAFMLKGSVIDLAVAFIIGAAFNAVVTAMVTDIFTPLIGIPGHLNMSSITYTVNGSTFLLGSFLNSVIAFASITIVVFFFIVKPVSKMKQAREKPAAQKAPDTKICKYCLSSIPAKATRCAFCTSKL